MYTGRSITYKYKNYKYDDNTENLLDVKLSSADEIAIKNIKDRFAALDINRGYEYIIEDLYILIEKRNISTTDIARIYDVSTRTVQVWLKELGLNRTPKEAQQIAVTKRDYKTIKRTIKSTTMNNSLSNELSGSEVESYVRNKLNLLLGEALNDYEVIVGINGIGISNIESDIPIVLIKGRKIFKFIIEIAGVLNQRRPLGETKELKKNILVESKGYKILELEAKDYFNDDNIIYKSDLDSKLAIIINQILDTLKGK
jgi:hypothetical protein